MATEADAEPEAGVEFIHEDDGSITARDIETGIASFGDTKAEALAMLADALELHETGGEELRETEGAAEQGLGDALNDLAVDTDVDSVAAVRELREDV
jgi:predicted RNase H-like HicB family nuclease